MQCHRQQEQQQQRQQQQQQQKSKEDDDRGNGGRVMGLCIKRSDRLGASWTFSDQGGLGGEALSEARTAGRRVRSYYRMAYLRIKQHDRQTGMA